MACASWPRGMRELQGPPCLVLASSRPALDDPAAEPRPKAEVKSPQIATSRTATSCKAMAGSASAQPSSLGAARARLWIVWMSRPSASALPRRPPAGPVSEMASNHSPASSKLPFNNNTSSQKSSLLSAAGPRLPLAAAAPATGGANCGKSVKASKPPLTSIRLAQLRKPSLGATVPSAKSTERRATVGVNCPAAISAAASPPSASSSSLRSANNFAVPSANLC
mmetsp:Transcript_66978/g.173668  ORF Transcript_66978/g.173668 Transcript_66978/m.173668 type:complete len:224 (+) Transcript_66978:914-1585(+)